MILIKTYSPDFENQLLHLLRHEEKDSKTNEPYDLEFFKEEYGSYYTKLIALEENNVIGTIVYSKQFDTLELNFIYVDPEFQGKGVSQKLFEELLQEKNVDGIRVNCGEDNLKAQKFYTKIGFVKAGEVHNYFSNNKTQYFYYRVK